MIEVKVVVAGRQYDRSHQFPAVLKLPEGALLDDALAMLAQGVAPNDRLPDSCLVAVSGVHLGTLARHSSRTLASGDELVLIAPLSGG